MKKLVFLLFQILLFLFPVFPNNLTISNLRFTGRNTSAHYVYVHFDVSWENSWRTTTSPGNWDAAWVFIKYRVGSGSWQHATLDVNSTNHNASSGSTITPTADGKGVFIYRNSDGTGTVNFTGTELRWSYGVDGIADTVAAIIKVFGIEMVYVPEGSFYAGDGTASNVEMQFNQGGSVTTPFQITSESSLTLGGTSSSNMGNNNNLNSSGNPAVIGDDFDDSFTQTLPSAFPKGYNAVYCMKYEITQKQYVAFLNSLDGTQQANRVSAISAGIYMWTDNTQTAPKNRNGIKCRIAPSGSVPGEYGNDLNNNGVYGETDDGQTISCNFLSWADGAAYLDWAGLRPMTELEFEKTCRGSQTAIANEYAWGDTATAWSYYSISDSNTASEGIATNYSTVAGNVAYGFTIFPFQGVPNFSDYGPLRVGIFAANSSNSGRLTSGASFYGIMELTGNNVERTISVGSTTGRAFTGIHGDGALDSNGDANVSNWPGITALGVGRRGGRWSSNVAFDGRRVSDRSGSNIQASGRDYFLGCRGVRTAP